MQIEVAYATPSRQVIILLTIAPGVSVIDAISLSRINQEFAEIDLSDPAALIVGVFGKRIDIFTYTLHENDRIEIYRPLAKTPNQRRLERANAK